MRLEFTVPRNIPATSPVSLYGVFMDGVLITSQRLTIPEGHKGLAFFQMRTGRSPFPVLPNRSSNVNWIHGENETLQFHEYIQLDPPQYTIELRGYNLDPFLDHTFIIDLD